MAYQQIHTRISAPLYEELKSVAEAQKISFNKLVENILQKFLEEHRKQQLAREIDRYVDQTGEHSTEFVTEFEPLVTRRLLEETEW